MRPIYEIFSLVNSVFKDKPFFFSLTQIYFQLLCLPPQTKLSYVTDLTTTFEDFVSLSKTIQDLLTIRDKLAV